MATVTVTPTVELDHTPPRVRLDVLDSGSPAVTSVVVVRHDQNGQTVPVRTTDGGPLGISPGGLLYDPEVPYGTVVRYSTVQNPATVSAAVTVAEARPWLINPGVPELSVPVDLRAGSFAEEEWAVEQAVFHVLGRERPVVHTDGVRKAPQSSMLLRTSSLAELEALRTILADASTLLLNIPPALGLGVATSYIAVGSVQNRRPINIGGNPKRHIVVPYTVVDRPVGGTQAERTWADVIVDNATWGEVLAKYDTWLDLLAGP